MLTKYNFNLSALSIFLLLLPILGIAQISIKVNSDYVSINDTMKIDILNNSQERGYYYIGWQVFEKKQWRLVKLDVWNMEPMTERWNEIEPLKADQKYYIVDDVFTGTFRKYEYVKSRLIMTYSFSNGLRPQNTIYSKEFIVKPKRIRT